MSARELLVLAKKVASKCKGAHDLPTATRLRFSLDLLAETPRNPLLEDFAAKLSKLDVNQQHYWIGTFYTLLLPASLRRAQAAYFTPPHLSMALLSLVRQHGFDPLRHTAIDPAAGGAAFLSTLGAEMHERGAKWNDIVRRLHGVEIDRGLARLSEALVAARIDHPIRKETLVEVKDALRSKYKKRYDLVIANPPYGRLSSDDVRGNSWEQVCHPGHLNKYALFTELCFRLAKPEGLIGLVLPSSFIAGPLYGRLRTFMREKGEILTLASVTTRSDVFVDVAQDVSLVIARAGTPHSATKAVSYGHVGAFGPFRSRSSCVLPASSEQLWMLPGKQPGRDIGGATLADYGAVLRAGYFVWNRELDRMSKQRRAKLDFPLIWARNIRPNHFCRPQAKHGSGIDFVHFDEESSGIVRRHAVVLQRTTNSLQARRLVAARVSPSVLKKWGGFVSENHTIVITAPTIEALNTIRLLLNSAAVDSRYRQLSGTASVSVTLLRGLDLPRPEALLKAIRELGRCEAAVERGYAISAKSRAKASA